MKSVFKLGASALALTVAGTSAWAEIDNAWWKEAAAPYQGVTIRGVTESSPPSLYIREVLAPEFEALTGIRVDVETTSWDQMFDKAIKDMEAGTGIYDMAYIEQDIIYSYLARDFLTDLTTFLGDNPGLKAATYDEANFTTFADYFKDDGGHLYGVPMEAFLKVYLYRTDLFNDPEFRPPSRQRQAAIWRPQQPMTNMRKSPASLPLMAKKTIWISGEPRRRRTPGMWHPGMNILNPWHPLLGSTTGGSTPGTITPLRLPMAAK
ncbi:extracellular solute-binding protein [Phaeobacter sp. J2-8]|uniref:ABC transporter substrate-binding protein n=1 Tax=Phaeobacter sp. J2-8 TaxID=2931394 RepID=UPI001FD30287|nr:extracellular solute-binding protein [Phaeobacter sp. J2-8]